MAAFCTEFEFYLNWVSKILFISIHSNGMVWDVFDLNLLCRVSIEEILRFLDLGFDCYCE